MTRNLQGDFRQGDYNRGSGQGDFNRGIGGFAGSLLGNALFPGYGGGYGYSGYPSYGYPSYGYPSYGYPSYGNQPYGYYSSY